MATYEVFEHQVQLKVYADGRYLAALQQGLYRPYVYPVRTLQGHVVTQAGPADHPHHLSIWLGHASVNGLNFWAPETLGICPPTHILVRDTRTDISADGVAFDQRIEWVDGAGGLVLRERRRTGVRLWAGHVAVDVAATLTAPDAPVELGAEKDAGLALRIADQIDVPGRRRDSQREWRPQRGRDLRHPGRLDGLLGSGDPRACRGRRRVPVSRCRGYAVVHARLRPDLRGTLAARRHDARSP